MCFYFMKDDRHQLSTILGINCAFLVALKAARYRNPWLKYSLGFKN